MNDITNDKIILICATGRSGSTTLLRIINSIPNTNICGENAGAINSLLEFYKRIKFSSSNYIPGNWNPLSYEETLEKNIKPAWYNSYSFQQIVENIRITIINMFKKDTNINIWGFKEIRYDDNNLDYIKEFKELFPQTKVIIQIRENLDAQSKSGWHQQNKNAINYLSKFNNKLICFYKQNKDYCYLTSFEKMFSMSNIQNIFKFIDCNEDFNETKIKEILNNNLVD